MFVGQVVGEVWVGKKIDALEDQRLLLVDPVIREQGRTAASISELVVAADFVGAEVGERVLVGRSLDLREGGRRAGSAPVESAIIAVVDTVTGDVPTGRPERPLFRRPEGPRQQGREFRGEGGGERRGGDRPAPREGDARGDRFGGRRDGGGRGPDDRGPRRDHRDQRDVRDRGQQDDRGGPRERDEHRGRDQGPGPRDEGAGRREGGGEGQEGGFDRRRRGRGGRGRGRGRGGERDMGETRRPGGEELEVGGPGAGGFAPGDAGPPRDFRGFDDEVDVVEDIEDRYAAGPERQADRGDERPTGRGEDRPRAEAEPRAAEPAPESEDDDFIEGAGPDDEPDIIWENTAESARDTDMSDIPGRPGLKRRRGRRR